MFGALNGLAIYAVDLDRLADFYATVLQLDVVERDTGYVVLSRDGQDVSLVAMPAEVAAQLVIASPPELRSESAIKPTFRVTSLVDAAHRAQECGGGTKPFDAVWEFRGFRRLDGHDPEGNVIQFVEPSRHAAP